MTIDTMVVINKSKYALKVMLGIAMTWRRCVQRLYICRMLVPL